MRLFKRLFGPPPESDVSRSEFAELKAQVKVLEREIDDLHASYRRLRGHKAGIESAAARAGVPVVETEPAPVVGAPSNKKAELWQRFTVARARAMASRANGESAEKNR